MSGLSGTSGLLPAMKRTIGYSWARTCRRGWLGRAVIGGLFAATLATLFLLPTVVSRQNSIPAENGAFLPAPQREESELDQELR